MTERPDDDQHDVAAAGPPALPELDVLGAGGFGDLLAQAQGALAAQAQAAEREVEGVSGGGAVRIRATGTGQVLAVTIAPEAVDPTDVPMLEDLVLAALHDLNGRLQEIQREALGGLADLGGLLGGGSP